MDMRRSREGARLSGRNGMRQAQREERTALGGEEWLVVSFNWRNEVELRGRRGLCLALMLGRIWRGQKRRIW